MPCDVLCMSPFAPDGFDRRTAAGATHTTTTPITATTDGSRLGRGRKTQRRKGTARSYRNSVSKKQSRTMGGRTDRRSRRSGSSNKRNVRHASNRDSKSRNDARHKSGKIARHTTGNGMGLEYGNKGAEFYRMMRERLYEMLGGKVCSGCGFRDERALGIAFRHAFSDHIDGHTVPSYSSSSSSPKHDRTNVVLQSDSARFDSVCRGGSIASQWPRYKSDPKLAASELVVLCLNCNRIREPVLRPMRDEPFARRTKPSGRGHRRRPPKTFPR